MDFEVFQRPGHLIVRTARLLQRWGEERFQALGLAVAQIPVLYILKTGTSLTQIELAKIAKLEQPTMAQLLTRMERDGLIQRTIHPTDKRSSLISLTPLALSKIPAAQAILIEGNREALQGFRDDEIATLCQLLRRVIHNLDPSYADGTIENPEITQP